LLLLPVRRAQRQNKQYDTHFAVVQAGDAPKAGRSAAEGELRQVASAFDDVPKLAGMYTLAEFHVPAYYSITPLERSMFFPLHDNIPAKRIPVVTYLLVAINVLTFIWVDQMGPYQQEVLVYEHGFVPARMKQLVRPQPIFVHVNAMAYDAFQGEYQVKQSLPLAPSRRQIGMSLLTCMFFHASWLHLLTNMWFLWLFGDNVEDRLGPLPFLFLYLVGGLIASLCHWAIGPNSLVPVIGASGAIAAILGAYAVTWPLARVSTFVFLVVFFTVIDVPAMVVLGVWFVAQVLAGQASLHQLGATRVAWWSHVGGFLAGMAIMPLLSLLFARTTAKDETAERGAQDSPPALGA
jgi:membrane associated rhomboid family serine protease